MHVPVAADRPLSAPEGELALVVRARQGDLVAFDRLVASRLTSTVRLARAIVGDHHEADDVTQEAFLQAWRNLPSLRAADRFDAWFGRILVNAARQSLRKRARVMTVDVDDLEADGRSHPALGRADTELESVVGIDALIRACHRLPAEQRTILALHHLEERSVADIAAILGIPVGTVKWRLHAARNALERALEAER
jgi:RNA polymerase sigma-70 factor (ECF subfamily)